MKEPKVYIGEPADQIREEFDVYIFLPPGFSGDKNELVDKAKLKFIELYERDKFRTELPPPKPVGVMPLPDRPKRRRIGQ